MKILFNEQFLATIFSFSSPFGGDRGGWLLAKVQKSKP
jgi:hypothetical protein